MHLCVAIAVYVPLASVLTKPSYEWRLDGRVFIVP